MAHNASISGRLVYTVRGSGETRASMPSGSLDSILRTLPDSMGMAWA